jgi:hypothetical protein
MTTPTKIAEAVEAAEAALIKPALAKHKETQ